LSIDGRAQNNFRCIANCACIVIHRDIVFKAFARVISHNIKEVENVFALFKDRQHLAMVNGVGQFDIGAILGYCRIGTFQRIGTYMIVC